MKTSRETRCERIFLTGFMGSGKSTIGPRVAKTIGYEFTDVDCTVERSAGKTINDIFHDDGEQHFRRLERRLVLELCQLRRTVVALGGGTLADPANLDLVISAGILVYLKMGPRTLTERLQGKTNRPLLSGLDAGRLDDPSKRNRVLELYHLREPGYNTSDIVVPTDDLDIDGVVDAVVRQLLPHLQ